MSFPLLYSNRTYFSTNVYTYRSNTPWTSNILQYIYNWTLYLSPEINTQSYTLSQTRQFPFIHICIPMGSYNPRPLSIINHICVCLTTHCNYTIRPSDRYTSYPEPILPKPYALTQLGAFNLKPNPSKYISIHVYIQ